MRVKPFDVRRIPRTIWAVVAPVFLTVVLVSFVPSDEDYYRVEYLLSYLGPLASASQHVRSAPTTLSSMMMEAFHSPVLEIEGVSIDLGHAVNPTRRVREHSFVSRVLGQVRTYAVYLPPGYGESQGPYPTLYLLHGMSQDQRWWTQVARVDRIATAMIEAGQIRPVIIVMPNGNRDQQDISTTSLYDDHCQTGLDPVARALKAIGDRLSSLRIYKVSCDADFELYISNELVEEVASRYSTNGENYVGGFSIGARGAVHLSLANSGVFDGAFGLSGNYDFVRAGLRKGEIEASEDMKLFLATGSQDQRGVYGKLNTFLLHEELARRGINHGYCVYSGSHRDATWVSAIPGALRFLLAAGADGQSTDGNCGDL